MLNGSGVAGVSVACPMGETIRRAGRAKRSSVVAHVLESIMKQMQASKVRSAKAAPPPVPRATAPVARRSRKAGATVTRTVTPSEATIREAAYLRYVDSGRADGHDVEHWLHAEAELRSLLNPT